MVVVRDAHPSTIFMRLKTSTIRQIRVICVLLFNGNAKNFSYFDFINNSVMINVL